VHGLLYHRRRAAFDRRRSVRRFDRAGRSAAIDECTDHAEKWNAGSNDPDTQRREISRKCNADDPGDDSKNSINGDRNLDSNANSHANVDFDFNADINLDRSAEADRDININAASSLNAHAGFDAANRRCAARFGSAVDHIGDRDGRSDRRLRLGQDKENE
jgi:hypothetical protein